MKKQLLSAAVLAFAAPAFAGLKLDSRFDYTSLTSNSQTTATQASESFWAFNYLRLAGDGKISNGLTFDSRVNFLAFAPTANGASQGVTDNFSGNQTKTAKVGLATNAYGVSPAYTGLLLTSPVSSGPDDLIDFAQVKQDIDDSFSIILGKLKDHGMGGFESQTQSADMYFASQGYLGNTFFTGAQLQYKLTDSQELDLYFLNNDSTTDSSRPAVNLVYHGAFGNLKVIANYAQVGEGTTYTNSANQMVKDLNKNYGNVGLKYDLEDWKFVVDYDFNTNATNSLSTAYNNKLLNDVIGQVYYNWGTWTPSVKVESFSRQGYQTAGTSDVTDNGINYSVEAEYKKNSTDPIQYHIAYVNGTTYYANNIAYGSTNSTVNGQFAYAGIRYVGDFLK